MTEELLERIKQKRRWPITFSDILNYTILIGPLGIMVMGWFALRSGIINNESDLKLVASIGMIIGLFLTIFVSLRLYQNQHFYSLSITNLSEFQIEAALKKTKFQNTENYKLGYFICYTSVSLFSWGEKITIILDDSKLLINSRPSNSIRFQPVTIMKDRKNIKIIIDELNKNCH